MPFDECNDYGGGGGHDPHNPELLQKLATVTLQTLALNCEVNDACEFHAGIVMQAMMIDGLRATHRKHNNEGSAEMIDIQIETLRRALTTLEEEKSK